MISQSESYAKKVVSGKIVTGRYIQLAAQRFLKDLKRKDIYLDRALCDKYINFAHNRCRLWEDKWRGLPMHLEPWMHFIYEQVFGWVKKKDGLRRVRKVYIEVAKKNAKSTGLAGVPMLFHLIADDRIKTPKIFTGANNEDQAKICVNIAGRIVEQSPDLYEFVEDKSLELFRYKENIVNIVDNERDGFIKAMSKEPEGKDKKQSGGKHGFNPSLYVIDEYAMADGAELLETLETAQAAREEPLGIIITTAGHKQNGPCYSQLRRTGIEILEGITEDDSYLPFIWEMDKGDSIYDEKVWPKCNPNLGVSVSEEFLRSQVRKAKNEGGSTEVNIRTLNFNEWCETPEVWISKDIWDRNTHNISEEELQGRECFGGLHIISSKELNALALFFPNVRELSPSHGGGKGEAIHAAKVIFWMPEKCVIDNKYKTDFARWVTEGNIITCPGNVIDNPFVFDLIMEQISQYQVHSIAFPTNIERHDITQSLVNAGIQCNPISQGYRGNSEPTFAWEGYLTAGNIDHFANPVLSWSNSNCMALRKGDDIRIERAGARTAGIIACINALAQYKTINADGMMNDFSFTSLK